MPRKERKKNKELKATKITPLTSDQAKALSPFKQTGETINVESANEFQKLCFEVSRVLKSEKGKLLNCRLKVLVENQSAIVYQGMLGNVWGRLKADGRHQIYRHALKNLLDSNPTTKSISSN
jgi:hypothetical protein